MRNLTPVAIGGGGMNLVGNNWLHRRGSGVDFSCRSTGSEHDLAAMVSDFLEIGSAGSDSWCSSDCDSGFSDLADRISMYKQPVDQYERDLTMVVKSLILSISETSQIEKPDACINSSCIIYSLVKLLHSSGYDAALCKSKWQVFGKLPGGEHEFIDVIAHENKSGGSERYIIDIDFRSHFQIARAVKSYNVVLSSLPAIYVGTLTKLKQLLQIMAEAAKYSLEQNSMPFPPWRSFSYLEAKWESPCQRFVTLNSAASSSSHQHCIGLLRRLKSFVGSDFKR
ncbi:hypothetical protein ABFS82_14G075600 [Erythranthe guttata]|uniref:DUF506 domain-containing protein n=1 Tax=Erythranthe guttata TaxID=4155 RepID=A0A022RE36_ERYGU|nr:PREDICTED: uncharacterized protein LOC105956617 [Erythranthe guttata]EYU38441.1 hypothetical protein MIMGU_mgv1a011446mg [Erythranthe guttata]|eukprot:XP_012835924.1 PREDICTED: uncharacterized protein LOC105956617 [Erythranthe guttata]